MGCIPTKALVRSAEAIYVARRGAEFGFHADVEVDFRRVVERKNQLVASTVRGLERSLDRNPRIELVRGRARFESPGRVLVGERELHADRVIVASGVAPHVPDIPGLESVGFLTNETIMDLEELPAHLIVLGGGAEGLEFGQAFRRFGSRVTIVQRNARLAPREDPDVSDAIAEILHEEGIEIFTSDEAVGVDGRDGVVVVHTRSGKKIEGDALLVSAGRKPHELGELGLEGAGIDADAERGIAIDDELRTSVPDVYAIGDVLGRVQHTHFATYTAGIAVANALDGEHRAYSLDRVPGAIFTDPEIASVGLTAEEARARGHKVRVGRQEMAGVGRARAMGETKGFVKFVVDAESGSLLGMHVVAHHGADLLPQGVIAMAATGTLAPLTDCICIHPTLSEGVKSAAGNLRPLEIPVASGDLPG